MTSCVPRPPFYTLNHQCHSEKDHYDVIPTNWYIWIRSHDFLFLHLLCYLYLVRCWDFHCLTCYDCIFILTYGSISCSSCEYVCIRYPPFHPEKAHHSLPHTVASLRISLQDLPFNLVGILLQLNTPATLPFFKHLSFNSVLFFIYTILLEH